MNYYAAFAKVLLSAAFANVSKTLEFIFQFSLQVATEIKPNTYVVSEGANTMDIGRVGPSANLITGWAYQGRS